MDERDVIVNKILRDSGIAGRRRRREVERELRAHLDDLAEEARAEGYATEEAEKLALVRFGSAELTARAFSSVYQSERNALYAVAFVLLAIVCLAAVYTLVYGIQYLLALGFGFSPGRVFAPAHLGWESLVLGGLTLGYLGLHFSERLFRRQSFGRAAGLMAFLFTAAGAGVWFWAPGSAVLLVATYPCAVLIRFLEITCTRSAFRVGGTAAVFVAIGAMVPGCMGFGERSSAGLLITCVFLVIALSCQLVTAMAGVFERQILRRHFV